MGEARPSRGVSRPADSLLPSAWGRAAAVAPARLPDLLLRFGLSDKPRDHDYSLAWQADLTEELVRRHGGGPVQLVAHDMGTSVATELLARDIDGTADVDLTEAVLFNGSMIIERASLTPGQKLLRSRLGPVFVHLSSGRFFRQQLGSVFGKQHPMSAEDGEDQWALMKYRGGNRIADKLIFERARHADRWHGAIRDWPKPLTFVWGMQDPVATTHVLDGLRDLRPAAPVIELPDLAHYPQAEDPRPSTPPFPEPFHPARLGPEGR